MTDTIFALSSGNPPAAIGVIRISGPSAIRVIGEMTCANLSARRPTLRKLRSKDGEVLDQALVIAFPGPNTATGEDLVEIHCHGGRAVVSALERELGGFAGLRKAEPGEFTKRAFQNGRVDLAEAEGLAELLAAETELQRSAAMAMASGSVSRETGAWRERLLTLSAQVEAVLDFSDDDDVPDLPPEFYSAVASLAAELKSWLSRPKAEKLGEGFKVVLAGPPNAGKSTLFNALVDAEAAITSATAGTTRDLIERSVSIDGIPFSFVDTAGLRDGSDDEIENIGIDRARGVIERADVVLWLGEEGCGPEGSWEVSAKADVADFRPKRDLRIVVSAETGQGVDELKRALVERARQSLPKPGEVALNKRQHELLTDAHLALLHINGQPDLLLIAEDLRSARVAFDRLIGRSTTEDMLDSLFGRFCIGK